MALPDEGPLEARLRAVESKWTAGKAQMMEHPRGSPCVLIISQSAVGANNLVKRLPTYNAVRTFEFRCKYLGVVRCRGSAG